MTEISHAELEIAEDYWRQRQAAQATQSGFHFVDRDHLSRWFETHKELLKDLAEQNGARGEAAAAVVDAYMQSILSAAPSRTFEDPNVCLLLSSIVQEIEAALLAASVPLSKTLWSVLGQRLAWSRSNCPS
jgi:hypothetical protein